MFQTDGQLFKNPFNEKVAKKKNKDINSFDSVSEPVTKNHESAKNKGFQAFEQRSRKTSAVWTSLDDKPVFCLIRFNATGLA